MTGETDMGGGDVEEIAYRGHQTESNNEGRQGIHVTDISFCSRDERYEGLRATGGEWNVAFPESLRGWRGATDNAILLKAGQEHLTISARCNTCPAVWEAASALRLALYPLQG